MGAAVLIRGVHTANLYRIHFAIFRISRDWIGSFYGHLMRKEDSERANHNPVDLISQTTGICPSSIDTSDLRLSLFWKKDKSCCIFTDEDRVFAFRSLDFFHDDGRVASTQLHARRRRFVGVFICTCQCIRRQPYPGNCDCSVSRPRSLLLLERHAYDKLTVYTFS